MGLAGFACIFAIGLTVSCCGWVAAAVASPACVQALRLGPSTGLPDCRAYEQATPPDKNGNSANGGPNLVQAAAAGGAITFYAEAVLPGSEGAQENPSYLSSRSGEAWSTQNLLPPADTGPQGKVIGWDEDLSGAFVINKEGVGPAFPYTLYLRESAGGALRQITGGFVQGNVNFVGATPANSVVAFEDNDALSGTNGTAGKFNVYVWDSSTEQVRLASVLNSGLPPTTAGSFAGPYEWWPTSKPEKGGAAEKFYSQAEHVLSTDGSRFFFTAGEKAPARNVQIYLRENPTQPQSAMSGSECTEADKACTEVVSASERTTPDPNGEKPAAFIGATPSGSKAFFMSPSELTDDATTGTTDAGNDLYRYETDAAPGHRLTDLAPDAAASNGAEVKGVLGIGGDGSYVYFVAKAALPGTTAPSSTCSGSGQGVTGTCNLYLWREDPTTHAAAVSFIAQLEGGGDRLDWSPRTKGTSNLNTLPTARVSTDGQTLLFASVRSLTGYANAGKSEIYRYRWGATPSLVCVSCSPTDAAPVGSATLTSLQAFFRPTTTAAILARNLSGDGNRVFFETPDPLVPADLNGVQDVYEWEAKGAGSCEGESEDGGCLYLLSTGTSPLPSYFADASESGDDAFLFTAQQLVGQDKDELLDVYDARVEGGLVGQNPVTSEPCRGEACKAPASLPPPAESPGSASFLGPGNQVPPHHARRHHRKKRHGKHHKRAHRQRGGGRQ